MDGGSHFCHRRDALHLREAAGTPHIRLHNVDDFLLDQLHRCGNAGMALARSDGERRHCICHALQ